MQNNLSLNISGNWKEFKKPDFKIKIIKNIITDRWSKYTIVAWKINSQPEIKAFIKDLNKDSYFRKSSHNTYAYRLELENWSILEWKNDDWETWAWNCILRELQRENAVDIILVVTRYFGWVKLQSDRFKNVINSCKMFFQEENNSFKLN